MVLEILNALAAVATVCGFLYEVAKDVVEFVQARRESSHKRMARKGVRGKTPPKNR